MKVAITTKFMVKNTNVTIKKMEEKEIKNLYDSRSIEIMQTVEDAYVRGSNRVQEIKNFARIAGIKRIGIAHCVTFPKEAEAVKQFLSDEFEVFSIDCKCGQITKHQMLGCEGKSIMCNPAGQADYLKDNNTELNISMGLCVGHDMVFNQKSASPVSNLVVKDRTNNNNPIETINNLKS
ncbi:MAG: DUF1847 domain-containing protein [Mariniphaga sp.]|nr:DUF1847 domain-containing protein [Mariniphaga sp.]